MTKEELLQMWRKIPTEYQEEIKKSMAGGLLGLTKEFTGIDKDYFKNIYENTVVPPVQQTYDRYLRPYVPEGLGLSGSPFSPNLSYETGDNRFDINKDRVSYTTPFLSGELSVEARRTGRVKEMIDEIFTNLSIGFRANWKF